MNEYERLRRQAERYREIYPPGTRVLLLGMDDPYTPVPSGTKGTVSYVDDQAQIHMKWDNGTSLALIPDAYTFRRLTEGELAEEQNDGMDESNTPVMEM